MGRNKTEDEKVKQLAENLRKNGLATNMEEAIETAKRILGEKTVMPEAKKDEEQKTLADKDSLSYDITKETKTLKELMDEEEKDE